MNITLHQLRILRAVVEEGGVSRAAALLHLTQPTLSVQLKQLAEVVGEPLFEHVGRRLHLTEIGHEVLKTAHAISREVDALGVALDDRRGIRRGRLRVAVVSTAEFFMPRVLGHFQHLHPTVEVFLRVLNRSDVIARLDDNSDDLYLMTRPPLGSGYRAEAVGPNPLVAVAAADHPWAGRRRIPVREFSTAPLIVREPGSGTRLSTEEWLQSRRHTLRVRLELGSNEAVKQAVLGGLGVALVSAHTVLQEINRRLLVVLNVTDLPIPARWHVVTRSGHRLSPVAEEFRRYLKKDAMPTISEQVERALGRIRHTRRSPA